MSARVAPRTDIVARCVPRHDGGYMIVTLKGSSAVSPTPINEGTHVVIRDGVAERMAR